MANIGCCRYCWGIGGRYQYGDGEYKDAKSENQDKNAMLSNLNRKVQPFDEKGGPGYHARRAPNPACPICKGEGRKSTRLSRISEKTKGPSSEALLKILKKRFAAKCLKIVLRKSNHSKTKN